MLALLIGLIIGITLGLTGAGGAIFAVPLFWILLELPLQSSIALSLATVALGAGIGSLQRYQSILWLPAILFALFGAGLAPVGRLASAYFNENLLLILFAATAVLIAVRMWQRTTHPLVKGSHAQHCELNNAEQIRLYPKCIAAISASGSATGFLSGLLGVGGGFLITPVLLRLTAASLSQVIATSLFIITCSAVSAALFSWPLFNNLSASLVTPTLLGTVLGVLSGGFIARYLSEVIVQRCFAALALLAAISVLIRAYI